jgi:isochorismate synthase
MEKETVTPEVSQREFLSHALSSCFDSNFSFALWRLPHSDTVHFAASNRPEKVTEVNLEESTPGFIFAPFDPAREKIFLPADEFFSFRSGAITASRGSTFDAAFNKPGTTPQPATRARYFMQARSQDLPSDEHAYKTLVSRASNAVSQGIFEKIVPSRFKTVALPENFDLLNTFDQLCALYPNALVSVFSSSITGTWVGATPEMLAGITRDQHFHTAAVAGTQPYHPGTDLRSVSWTQKDIEEQALVERYVISCFKKIRLREYDEHGPKTSIAGNVMHLKTDFEVDMIATNFPLLGSTMLRLLHPTSAVCGMPLEASLEFIRTQEGYDRQYYSGFLGPVRINDESCMYVNIRCMQLFGTEAVLYAGAGVLADSDPDKEWSETEMKMNTLGRIIGK